MSNPVWLKKHLKMKPEVETIFETLDKYREFCVTYGFVYDEAHLGNDKSPWADYQRSLKGKEPRNNWVVAAEQFKRSQSQE
ncbi:MAG: hypothetical protein N2235_05285 [Fischerella sp.]|nr:hypothetical protein [Fischerella sp.]